MRLLNESEAWILIDSLSTEEILHSLPPRSVHSITPSLRTLLQECCSIPLRKIEEDPSCDLGWKLLLLLPRMILQPQVRGGKVGVRDTKARYQRFIHFHWRELIQFQKDYSPPICSSKNEDDHRKRVAIRLVRCGELSRAAKALTSQGLAPANDETLNKLRSKYPSRREGLCDGPCMSGPVSSLTLKSSVLFDAIRKAPRGSGAGPSGWRYEHIRALLDNIVTCDLLYQTCSLITEGKIPDSVVPLLSASRLIALPKANSDVRPIAIGEVLRRITAKAICLQKNASFSCHFAPL